MRAIGWVTISILSSPIRAEVSASEHQGASSEAPVKSLCEVDKRGQLSGKFALICATLCLPKFKETPEEHQKTYRSWLEVNYGAERLLLESLATLRREHPGEALEERFQTQLAEKVARATKFAKSAPGDGGALESKIQKAEATIEAIDAKLGARNTKPVKVAIERLPTDPVGLADRRKQISTELSALRAELGRIPGREARSANQDWLRQVHRLFSAFNPKLQSVDVETIVNRKPFPLQLVDVRKGASEPAGSEMETWTFRIGKHVFSMTTKDGRTAETVKLGDTVLCDKRGSVRLSERVESDPFLILAAGFPKGASDATAAFSARAEEIIARENPRTVEEGVELINRLLSRQLEEVRRRPEDWKEYPWMGATDLLVGLVASHVHSDPDGNADGYYEQMEMAQNMRDLMDARVPVADGSDRESHETYWMRKLREAGSP